MTTVSTYQPCLTYEVPFDETTGDKYKLTVESVDPDEAKQTRSMRKFTGNTIEELLYTREVFLNDTGDMEIDESMLFLEWQAMLGAQPRMKWKRISIANGNPIFPNNQIGFTLAMVEYIKEYAEDPLARDTVINSFGTSKFKKPFETSIRDHQDRMETLMNYVDVLPGVRQTDLTYQERKNVFFNTHPED